MLSHVHGCRDPLGPRRRRLLRALTMVELVVVMVVVGVLAMLVLTTTCRNRSPTGRINCANNLKLIGVGMRLFATDHQGRFPMDLAAAEGGSRDILYGGTSNVANPLLEFHPFYAARNELGTPKVVACPMDRARGNPQMTNWVGVAFPGGKVPASGGTNANDFATSVADWNQGRGNKAVSYTIGLEAKETKPNMILATDRNLKYAGQVDVAKFPMGLDPRLVVKGKAQSSLGWDASIHGPDRGNILMADGSALPAPDARLRGLIQFNSKGTGTNVTVTTNWLLFPVINGEQTKW